MAKIAYLADDNNRVIFGDSDARLYRQPNGFYRAYFPRNDERKLARMTKFVEWKRDRLAERHKKQLIAVTIFFFGLPIVIAAVSWLWRAAIFSVMG